jgi:hypothetical protein
MIWRCRDVSVPTRSDASLRQADSLVVSRDCSSARCTLASSSARPTGFSMKSDAPAVDSHRHVAVSSDHDGWQSVAAVK